MRILASSSARVAVEVRTLIESCCYEVTQGSIQINRIKAAVTELVALVHQVNNIIGDITHISDEQRHSIEQINIVVSQMDEAMHRNASRALGSSNAAHLLEMQVTVLANSIDVLRLGQQAISAKFINLL